MTPSSEAMFSAFLRVAAMLEERFGVTPLLFGSLGLERRLGVDLRPDDIDVLIPRAVLRGRWDELIAAMERLGYRLYDEEEHAFSRDGVRVAFASLEGLRPFAGVEIGAIPVEERSGVRYLLLDLPDYLKVYTASSRDGYRKNVKHKQDAAKIRLIEQALRPDKS